MGVLDRKGDQPPLRIERQARAEIDRPRDPALDHLGGLVFVCVDAAQKLGRDVLPAEAARAVRAERVAAVEFGAHLTERSEEHTSELQSLMRISYAVFCLKKTTKTHYQLHSILN